MRIQVFLKECNNYISLNYQNKLTGVINKWIGKNNREHGNLSLYSFSQIKGGDVKENKIRFNSSPYFFISTHDTLLTKEIIKNIQSEPTLFDNLVVKEIIICNTPDFSCISKFQSASPIFIKRRVSNSIVHVPFTDENAGLYLKETLESKMKLAGIVDDTLEINFDKNYPYAKTKVVHYGDIKNKANVCPVIINGKPETKEFAWNVGLGNSTGIGFGAII